VPSKEKRITLEKEYALEILWFLQMQERAQTCGTL
jgi:hypothetical protein